MEKKLVKIGFCSRVHGIKGGFSFVLENTDQSLLKKNQTIFVSNETESKPYEIQSISFGNKVICYLKNIADRNLAESLVPFDIYIDRSDFPKLSADEIYFNDLIGMKVVDSESKDILGKVVRFMNNTAQDILVINSVSNQEILLPYLEQFIVKVDEGNRIIYVNSPEYIQ